eukprot:3467556-Amphidinium_carterae.1
MPLRVCSDGKRLSWDPEPESHEPRPCKQLCRRPATSSSSSDGIGTLARHSVTVATANKYNKAVQLFLDWAGG